MPYLQLSVSNDRLRIHHHLNGFYLIVLRRLVVHTIYQSHILLASTEGYEYAHTLNHTHPLRDSIGEGGMQGNGQDDVSVLHLVVLLGM